MKADLFGNNLRQTVLIEILSSFFSDAYKTRRHVDHQQGGRVARQTTIGTTVVEACKLV